MATEPEVIPPPRETPPNAGDRPHRGVTCEFCESRLSAGGEVLQRGAKARAMMELDEQLATARRERDAATARVTEVQAELDAVKASHKPAKRYGRFED